MNRLVHALEARLSRIGVVMPRVFIGAFGGLVAAFLFIVHLGGGAQWVATILLHGFFPVAWALACLPLLIADPTRSSGKVSVLAHGLLLGLSASLTSFFILGCDLLHRDDRAFWALSLGVGLVLLSRLWLGDLLIRGLSSVGCASRGTRRRLLSLYSRMLEVDPALADLGGEPLVLRSLARARALALRTLGLRMTRSLPFERSVAARSDLELARSARSTTPEALAEAINAVADELRLQLALVQSPVAGAGVQAVIQRWPSRWVHLWSMLRRESLRLELRGLVTDRGIASLIVLSGRLARAIGGDTSLVEQAELHCAEPDAARITRLSPLWEKMLATLASSGRTVGATHSAVLLAESMARSSPEEFERRLDRLKGTAVMSPVLLELMELLASRSALRLGGLTPAEEGRRLAAVMRSASRLGMVPEDFAGEFWRRWVGTISGSWPSISGHERQHAQVDASGRLLFLAPGPGRISIGLPLATAVLVVVLLALGLFRTPYVRSTKAFEDVFHPVNRLGSGVNSIDLSSDRRSLLAATDTRGVVVVDTADYSVREVGPAQGLSTSVVKDVVALRDGGFLALTQGYGARGLDRVGSDGVAMPVIGMPEPDVAGLTDKDRSPLRVFESGDNMVFLYDRDVMLYRAADRTLVRMRMEGDMLSGARIIDGVGSRKAPGKLWAIVEARPSNSLVEIDYLPQGQARFRRIDYPVMVETADGDAVNASPTRLLHDGGRLWCLDRAGNLRVRADNAWVLRSGSPPGAGSNGGMRTAQALAVSDLGLSRPGVLWMLKGDRLYVRVVPADEKEAMLPPPWVLVPEFKPGSGYLGRIHAFVDDGVAMLLLPWSDRIDAVRLLPGGQPGYCRGWALPSNGYVLTHADATSDGMTLCLESEARTEVRFIPAGKITAASGLPIANIGELRQSSLRLSSAFEFGKVVGVAQRGRVTHQVDQAGHLLSFAVKAADRDGVPVLNGLAEPGSRLLDLPWDGLPGQVRIRSVSQSGKDGDTLLVSADGGLAELPLSPEGRLGASRSLIAEPDSGPSLALGPIAVTTAGGMPEIFFAARPKDGRPVAQAWQVSGRSAAPAMDWQLKPSGFVGPVGGSPVQFFEDSVMRCRVADESPTGWSYGPLVAISPSQSLVWRSVGSSKWNASELGGPKWFELGHAGDGLTVALARDGSTSDSRVSCLSVLSPSADGTRLVADDLWRREDQTSPVSAPHMSLAVVVSPGLFVVPTVNNFASYDLKSRKWGNPPLGSSTPPGADAKQVSLMACYKPDGQAELAWWWSRSGAIWCVGEGRGLSARLPHAIMHAEWQGHGAAFITERAGVYSISLDSPDHLPKVILEPEKADASPVSVSQLELGASAPAFLGADGFAYSLQQGVFVKSAASGLRQVASVGQQLIGLRQDGALLLPMLSDKPRALDVAGLLPLGKIAVMRAADGAVHVFGEDVDDFWSLGREQPERDLEIGDALLSACALPEGLFVAGRKGILFRPDRVEGNAVPGFRVVSGSKDGAEWLAVMSGGVLAYRFESGRLKVAHVAPEARGYVLEPLETALLSPGNGAYFKRDDMLVGEAADSPLIGGKGALSVSSDVSLAGDSVLHLSPGGPGERIACLYNPSTGHEQVVPSRNRRGQDARLGPLASFVRQTSTGASTAYVRDEGRLFRYATGVGSGVGALRQVADDVCDVLAEGTSLFWLESVGASGGAARRLAGSGISPANIPVFAAERPLRIDRMFAVDSQIWLLAGSTLARANPGNASVDVIPGSAKDLLRAGTEPIAVVEDTDRSVSLVWLSSPEKRLDGVSMLGVTSRGLAVRYDNTANRRYHWLGNGRDVSQTVGLSVEPGADIELSRGRSALWRGAILHIDGKSLRKYSPSVGSWEVLELPGALSGGHCEFRAKDSSLWLVDLATGTAAQVLQDGALGPCSEGHALGINLDGDPVMVGLAGGQLRLTAGMTVIKSEVDSWRPRKLPPDLGRVTYRFAVNSAVLIASDSDKRRLWRVQMIDGEYKASEVTLPFDVSGASVFGVGKDGLMFVNGRQTTEAVLVRADGAGMSLDAKSGCLFGAEDFADTIVCPPGWVHVGQEFVNKSSGLVSGQAVVPGSRLELSGADWTVEVAEVSTGSILAEKVTRRSLLVHDADKLSRIDTSFAPAVAAFAALGAGGVDIDIGGRRTKLFPSKAIRARDVAEADDIRSFAFDQEGRLYLIDRAGGIWVREAVASWTRRYLGAARDGAEFVLIARGVSDDNPLLGLKDGNRLSEVSPEGLKPCAQQAALIWHGMAEASGECDGISFTASPDGFRLQNRYGLDLGISSSGWTVGGGAVDLALGLHDAEGAVLLFGGMTFSGRRTQAYARCGSAVGLSDIRPLTTGKILPKAEPAPLRAGRMQFTQSGQRLDVTSIAGHRYKMLGGGGLAVDRIALAASARSPDGAFCLVHASSEAAEVYYRNWSDAGLGEPVVLASPYGASAPTEIFSYGAQLYVVYPQGWAVLKWQADVPSLEPTASMVAEWARSGSSAQNVKWRYDGLKLEHRRLSDGAWEQVPYSLLGGFALACDRPSWAPSCFRYDAQAGLVYRSALSTGDDLWYVRRSRESFPEVFKGSVPAPFAPPSSRQFDSGLGTASRIDSSVPGRYWVTIEGETVELDLTVAEGARLPHLRPKAPFVPLADGLAALTCQSSGGRKVFLAIEPDSGGARCTLKPPAVQPVRYSPAVQSQCELGSPGLRFGWRDSGELYLESSIGGQSARFVLGKCASNEPLELDDPGKVRLVHVDSKSVTFTLVWAGDCQVTLPRESLRDLSLAKIVRMTPGQVAQDPFARRAFGSSGGMPELRTPEASGKLPSGADCPVIAQLGADAVALQMGSDGIVLPLQRMAQKGFWALPFCDVMSGCRAVSGDYFVQSSGGTWIARYDSALVLVACRTLDPAMLPGRFVADSDAWTVWWKGPVSGTSVRLGQVDISCNRPESATMLEVSESVKVLLGKDERYHYEVGGGQVDVAGMHEYPGCRIIGAFLRDSGKIDLLDCYGGRCLVDGTLGAITVNQPMPSRILGRLGGEGGAEISCGAWLIRNAGGSYAVVAMGRPVLGVSGAPFFDRVMDADASLGELAVDVDSHIAVVDARGVRNVLQRRQDGVANLANMPRCRYVSADDSPGPLLSAWGLDGSVVSPVTGVPVDVVGDACLPYAAIESRGLSIVGSGLGRTLQMRLNTTSGGVAYRHTYDGARMFAGCQLAVDSVDSLTGDQAGIVVGHPQDGAGRAPLEAFSWQSVVPRSAPQATIDVPAQLLHPWTEPRVWKVDAGAVHWVEKGARWGD